MNPGTNPASPAAAAHRLSLTGLLVMMACVVGVLGWLLFGFAGDRSGVIFLPGPANPGHTVEYFHDQGGRLAFEDVERLAPAEWRVWSGRGYVDSSRNWVVWLRITLRNPGERPLHGVLENDDFFVDRAEAWVRGDEPETVGGRTRLASGETVPAAEKALGGREVAWPVTVPARGERVVMVRMENFFGVYARPVWWADDAVFQLARMRGGIAEGIYLGGLLALLGYTTLLWMRLRARDIGYYVLYLGTAAVFMVLARAWLPALGWTLGSPGLEAILGAVIAASGFFLARFAREFLELDARFPRTDRWVLRGWCVVLLVLVVGSCLSPWSRWGGLKSVILALGITHAGLFVLAVAAWRAGVRQARFFLLSFGCLFAGSLPMVAVWFFDDLLRDVGMRGLMIGSALEMLLLSLALADRFVRTQRALVEETEQRRMIEEAYAGELAEEVRERTRELSEANADKDRMLAVIGHDLRSPLTGLMRSADAASGEFARETARTGRALLLMIEDLVRWARLRAGTRVVATHRAGALVAPAVALHHALAEAGGVALVLEVPEDLRVETDLVLAQTLVRNLLANALKFAETRVVLRAADDGAGGVRVTVGNDGPPLPAAVAARLAAGEDEPMTATGGMGLRLCREICRALGTRLEAGPGVTSEGGGTEFRFTLPQAGEAKEENA